VIRRHRAVALALALTAPGIAASCATTYDASEATTIPTSTSTTVPSGTPGELLTRLLDEASTLGTLIDEHSSESTPVADQVQALWNAVRKDVERTHPQLLDEFDTNIERCLTAVERNRPADADKAYRNLVSLVTSYASGAVPSSSSG
jgi:hypothetical protein